jgi:predicted phage baseplate assembly protein
MATANRPGLDALRYRVGTHGTFLETMKARLATMEVQAAGADGQTIETFRPLKGLTTRDAGDPAIALLDAWATVGDVLTFYQERLANEGYLGTATERRSILELARLVGYTPRPGVASTVFLAYTLEDRQAGPVEIPAGARSQSVPGPGELPQSFETSDSLIARTEWNNLQVRLKQPKDITLENVMTIEELYVAGTSANLKAGDSLLLVFGDKGEPSVLRTVAAAESQFEDNRTKIELQPVPAPIVAALPLLVTFVAGANALVTATSGPERSVLTKAQEILTDTYLGVPTSPVNWARDLLKVAKETEPQLQELVKTFVDNVKKALESVPSSPPTVEVTDPSKFVKGLLKPPVPQKAGTLQLSRSLKGAFHLHADLQPQLLVAFSPQLKDTFYTAWSNANVNTKESALKAVYAFRVEASLFGASASKQPTYYLADAEVTIAAPAHKEGQLKPPQEWDDWPLEADESGSALFLDQAHDDILPASYAVIQHSSSGELHRLVRPVTAAQTAQRTAYGVSGKTTRLAFGDPWWKGKDDLMSTLRSTLVYGQSEELTLADNPITADVQGQEIPLDALYSELASGRWVILSGERTDIPGVTGVNASELLMISGLRQEDDKSLPGDTTHTTLLLATPTAYHYKRDTLTIYGNVVKATHGETRNETLGSGDGSQALQSFTLKQPPLTFVPAPTPAGVDSTLKVYVNDVQWHEADTLAGLTPKDRQFITKTDDDAKTTVIFGNGQEGARLPTGLENVKSVYRNGIGKPGNVVAEQISLLQSRPLGVKSVINPLRASGGADKESRDQARENAPLAVMSLDRLVSLQDYADFTRTFAGIGKASSRYLSDGARELVHITIAGADDIPIDPVSDLYRNLLIALREFGDQALPIQVDLRELVVLVLSANVRLAPDYQWEPVVQKIRASLLDTFGFQRRALGQPVFLSEVISLVQSIEGVAYVDVDAFGDIPERKADTDGKRVLLTLDDLTAAVEAIVNPTSGLTPAPPGPARRVDVNLADFENSAVRPAQLAIFTPTVADTVILNQIV